jgi:hypothetical protein
MASGLFANLSNYVQVTGMRRIVVTHRHLRESRNLFTTMFLSLDLMECLYNRRGLYTPHMSKVTVPRTGTLPPPSCGKGPNAAGERVMVLPGSLQHSAVRLTGKGRDRVLRKRATRVLVGVTPHQGGRESRPQGERW